MSSFVKDIHPIRLGILLLILAVFLGALGYDYFVAKPAVTSAVQRVQDLVDERHKQGVGEGDMPQSDEVQKAIGFAPTRTEKVGDHTIEWYCWWGKMPLLSERRRYMWVRYEGKEPQHVSTFDFDNKPEPETTVQPPPHADDGDRLPKPGNIENGRQQPGGSSASEKPVGEPVQDKPAPEKPADNAASEKPVSEKPAEPPSDRPASEPGK